MATSLTPITDAGKGEALHCKPGYFSLIHSLTPIAESNGISLLNQGYVAVIQLKRKAFSFNRSREDKMGESIGRGVDAKSKKAVLPI